METIEAKNLPRLGELLWSYRRAMDRLEFCLEIQLRLTVDGDDRWGGHVADLVDEVSERIGLLDLERDVLLGDGPKRLSELIDIVAEPWPAILVEHEAELRASTDRIQRLMGRNELAIDEHRTALAKLSDMIAPSANTATYDRSGRTRRSAANAVLFDGRA